MSDNITQAILNFNAGERVSNGEYEAITQELRNELLETDVKSVAFMEGGEPLEGSRAFEFITLGTLLVTLAASGGVFTTLINTISGWLARDEKRSITLEIDGDKISITGSSSEEEKQLIKQWIRRHKKT
jgi:hypothetical protein